VFSWEYKTGGVEERSVMLYWTIEVGGKVLDARGRFFPKRGIPVWPPMVCGGSGNNGSRIGVCGFDGEDAMGVVVDDVVKIKVKRLNQLGQMPRYAHTGPFGDLAADLYSAEGTTIAAGATAAVSTGVAMEFPSTHGALVEDRSGLAMRGVTTLAGVIDPGYRGEIKVVMANLGAAALEIQAGDRIAQLRIVRRIEAEFEEVEELVEAPRGVKGFGSTGN
jgi:dUTP pyrophosphatase